MSTKLTKKDILDYLKKYYSETHKIPSSKDKSYPFTKDMVRHKFGGWNKALTEAGIPLRNDKKLMFEYVKDFINKENELFSKTYINSKELLDIKCHKCSNVYKQNFARYKRGHRCRRCAIVELNKKRNLELESCGKLFKKEVRSCIQCNIEYIPTRTKQKLCSLKCASIFQKTDQTRKDNAKQHGRKGGVASAAKQVRRSKAEMMFADLCINHFGEENIKCNEPYFRYKNGNFWDADIIITSIKTAVLYNGIWHYQQVRKNHNLKQVQARDTLKQSIITDNGFKYYIVKDMGKFDNDFVKTQFNLFLHKLSFKSCLENLRMTLK